MGRPKVPVKVEFFVGRDRMPVIWDYPSMLAAAKDLKCQTSHISEVVAGKRYRHKGMWFSRIEEE